MHLLPYLMSYGPSFGFPCGGVIVVIFFFLAIEFVFNLYINFFIKKTNNVKMWF